ncbi:MAG TPA: hypothetical protein V6C81_13005 [Planktothrix sp.]
MSFTKDDATRELEQYASDVAAVRAKAMAFPNGIATADACLTVADTYFSSANTSFAGGRWQQAVDNLTSGRFYLDLATEVVEEYQAQTQFFAAEAATKLKLPEYPEPNYCDGDQESNNYEWRGLALLLAKAEASVDQFIPDDEHALWCIDQALDYLNELYDTDDWDNVAPYSRDGRLYANLAIELVRQFLQARDDQSALAKLKDAEENYLLELSEEDDDDTSAAADWLWSAVTETHKGYLECQRDCPNTKLVATHIEEAIAFRDAARDKYWDEEWNDAGWQACEAVFLGKLAVEMSSTYAREVRLLVEGPGTYEADIDEADYTEDSDDSDRQDALEQWRQVAIRGVKAQAYLDSKASGFTAGEGFLQTAIGYIDNVKQADDWDDVSDPLRDAKYYFNLAVQKARSFVANNR